MTIISQEMYRARMDIREGLERDRRKELDRELICRIKERNVAAIPVLLAKGAHPDARDEKGNPALVVAADLLFIDGIDYLIDGHANPRQKNLQSRSAKHVLFDKRATLKSRKDIPALNTCHTMLRILKNARATWDEMRYFNTPSHDAFPRTEIVAKESNIEVVGVYGMRRKPRTRIVSRSNLG